MIDPIIVYNTEFQRTAVADATREDQIARKAVRYTRQMRQTITLADIQDAIECADANLKTAIVENARNYDETEIGLAISAAIHAYLSKLADKQAEKEVD